MTQENVSNLAFAVSRTQSMWKIFNNVISDVLKSRQEIFLWKKYSLWIVCSCLLELILLLADYQTNIPTWIKLSLILCWLKQFKINSVRNAI